MTNLSPRPYGPLTPILRPTLAQWPWVALLSSLIMLAIAHAFETFGHLAPCELCLKERQVYWAAAGLAAAIGGLRLSPLKPGPWLNGVLALLFFGGAVLAAYHAGAEWKFWPGPASCSGGQGHVTAADLMKLFNGGPLAAPACDKAAWIFLGVSMAGWNALISLKLAVLSAMAART